MNRKRQSQTERSRVPLRPEFARESRGGGHTHEPRSSTAANVSVRIAALEAELQELREQLAIERDDREVQERSWIESQRELELSRQRYADLYHHAPIGIVTFDRTGFVREANQTAATLLGVDRSRLLDRTLLRLVVPADRQKLLRHFVRCRRNRGQAPVVTELRVTGARRQVLNIALTSVPEAVMGKPHEPARLRTSLVDITAHKRIEEALRESEQRYRLAVDFTYDWESWLDPRGRYVYVSPSCERIAGRTPAEFLADAGLLRRLIHPADRSRYDKHVRLHKRRGGPGEEEWRVRHTDGSYRWIGHACQPVYDEHGEYLGIRVSNRDITAGKQAEAALRHLNATLEQRVAERTAALRESEERFRQMAESVGEVFWLADIHLRKIFYVSPAFAKIWGISCQQLYENPALWFQAVHPDDRAIVKAAFFQKRTGSAPLTAEYRIVRPDGSVRWIEDRG